MMLNFDQKVCFLLVLNPKNYQIVATGDSVAQAEQAYYACCEANGKN